MKSKTCINDDKNPRCYSLRIETKDIYSYESWNDAFVKTSWNAETPSPIFGGRKSQKPVFQFKILKIIDQVAYLTFTYYERPELNATEYKMIFGKGIIHLPTIAGGVKQSWSHSYLHFDAETAQPYYAWMKNLNLDFQNYKYMSIRQFPITIEGKFYRLIRYEQEERGFPGDNSSPNFTLDNAQDPHAEFHAVRLALETNREPRKRLDLRDLSYHNGRMIMSYVDTSLQEWHVKEFVCEKRGFQAPTSKIIWPYDPIPQAPIIKSNLVAEDGILEKVFPGYAQVLGPFEGGL